MEMNENLVTEEVTENVEQTTEETQQPIKTYTQEEVDSIVGKAKARAKAKIQKEYDQKYGDLYETIKAGMGGAENVEDLTNKVTKFYEGKGIKINKPQYSAGDIETLAKAEAREIIDSGFDEVVEEVNRLTEIGLDNMSVRDKALYGILAKHRLDTERSRELAEIGIPEEVYNSQEFQDYAAMFKSDISTRKIYDNFIKTQPKKEVRTMGSMKTNESADNGVKDYYSPEEARRFTKADLDKNPALMAAIEKSMLKWSRKS